MSPLGQVSGQGGGRGPPAVGEPLSCGFSATVSHTSAQPSCRPDVDLHVEPLPTCGCRPILPGRPAGPRPALPTRLGSLQARGWRGLDASSQGFPR